MGNKRGGSYYATQVHCRKIDWNVVYFKRWGSEVNMVTEM